MSRWILSALFVVAVSCTAYYPEEPLAGRYHVDFNVESGESAKTALKINGKKVSYIWIDEAQDAFAFIQNANSTIKIEPSTSFSVGIDGKASVGADFSVIPGAASYNYAGVYPREAIQTVPASLESCTLNLPAVQNLSMENFDPSADLMFSKPVSSSSLSQSFSLSLRRLVAIGRMTILNLDSEIGDKIRSVQFCAPGIIMNGKVNVNVASGTVNSYGLGEDFVRMESSSGVEIENSPSFWFTCFPCAVSAGMEYSVCVHTDRHCYIKTGTIPSGTLSFSESDLTSFSVDFAGVTPTDQITYEMYGAAGDGLKDDMPAIVAAHEAANLYDIPVVTSKGKTYLIGNVARTAIIETDVDWEDSKFIINDDGLEKKTSSIFKVLSRMDTIRVGGVSSLYRGATSLGVSLPCRSLVEVINENKKIFIRSGSNENEGSSQTEYLIIAPDGSISEETPVTWDYVEVTSAVAYPIDTKSITVRGGVFTTKVSPLYSEDSFSRNIVVARSNTRLVGIRHYVEGEGTEGAPYTGFITVSRCCGVELDSIVFTAHKTYYKTGALGTLTAMGTYDLSLSRAVGVTVKNCSQSTDILDSQRWGIMGSNFCRNLTFRNSTLSRFDAHQGVYNAVLSDCELGTIGCTGFGTLTVENSDIHSSDLITLRGDYGAFFRGDVIFRNCDLYPQSDSQVYFIHAYNTGVHDYGYDCMLPTTITIDGLTVYDNEMTMYGYAGPQIFSDVTRKAGAVYPYTAPQRVDFTNLCVESGKAVTVGPSASFYADTEITGL